LVCRFLKTTFFRNFTTWYSSNFYGTNRAHPDTPLEMKIEKSKNRKKTFLGWEKGGGGVAALTVTCILSSFDVHLLMFVVFPCFRFLFLDALFCVCLVIRLSLVTSVFSCEIYFYVKVLLFFCFYFFLTATFSHYRSTLRSLFSLLINCQLISLFFIQ
jgi:hypothetical protein